MIKLAVQWAISTGALLLLPLVFGTSVDLDDVPTAIIAALVVGLVNVSIRPVLRLLSLPARVLTLGLFGLVINGFCLYIVAKLVPGFTIDGFWVAMLAAIVYSVVTWAAGSLVDMLEDE